MMESVTPRGTSSVALKFSAHHAGVMYQHGLMGGTFDRVHAGHFRLITEALRNCKFWRFGSPVTKLLRKRTGDAGQRTKEKPRS